MNETAPFNRAGTSYFPGIDNNKPAFNIINEHFRGSSEGTHVNYSLDNLQRNQELENKENLNLLESHNSSEEEKNASLPLLNGLAFPNRICKRQAHPPLVEIEESKNNMESVEEPNMDRPK